MRNATLPLWSQTPEGPSLADANLSNEAYAALVESLLKVATDAAGTLVVRGDESPRELALRALNIHVLGMMLGAAGSIATGTATGTAIGGIATSWTGPGFIAGAAVGGGIGLMLSTIPVVIFGIAYVDTLERVNAKYPPAAQTASLLRLVPQAGQAESLAVHFLTLLFPADLAPIAERWDMAPNLPPVLRSFLARHRFLQAPMQKLMRVIRTQKIAPNAFPALPISQFDVVRTILFQQQPEQNWLEWMGLTTLKLRADDARLTLTLPAVLTQLGAPARLRTDLPNFTIRVGGDGGAIPYIQFALRPSAFDLTLGESRLVGSGRNRGLVRLSFRIAKGATLGSASGSFKWGPAGGAITFTSPRLLETLRVDIFLKPEGPLLVFDHVELGELRLSLDTPDVIKNLPGIGDLIDQILKGMVKFFTDLFTSVIGWASQFQQLATYSTKALERALDEAAHDMGVLAIREVRQLQSAGEILQAQVRTTVLNLPNPLTDEKIRRLTLTILINFLRTLKGQKG